jgi:hypothetical protein
MKFWKLEKSLIHCSSLKWYFKPQLKRIMRGLSLLLTPWLMPHFKLVKGSGQIFSRKMEKKSVRIV